MNLALVRDKIGDLEAFTEDDVTEAIAGLTEADLRTLLDNPTSYRASIDRIRPPKGGANERNSNIMDYICDVYAQREEIVKMVLACAMAQVPMVLLGPPGTAKSEIVRTFCGTLGLRENLTDMDEFEKDIRDALAKDGKDGSEKKLVRSGRGLFSYLVTRYTTPEEILGPVNIDAMLKLSLYYRESAGMLPNAKIAFLDEIFKANSAILNALLSIINERIYYNAGRAFKSNLMVIIGASNESPDTEELVALYDRFPIRVLCDYVPDEHGRELLDKAHTISYKKGVSGAGTSESVKHIACLNDFLLMSRLNYVNFTGPNIFSRESMANEDASGFAKEFMNMFLTFREEFGISDRTPIRLLRVMKALALIDNKTELDADLLRVFKYCAPDIDTARVLSDVVEETILRINETAGRNVH